MVQMNVADKVMVQMNINMAAQDQVMVQMNVADKTR